LPQWTHSKWVIHFGWVKGHSGIEGNELVDRLAKAAAVEDGPVVYDKIPREVIMTRAKENKIFWHVIPHSLVD
jgi:ribonuclease HI